MCPYCRDKEVGYSYAGAWPPASDFDTAKTILLTYDTTYPNMRFEAFELLKCDCGKLWLTDYYFPDHPPVMVNATALITPQQRNKAFETLMNSLEANLSAGMLNGQNPAELKQRLFQELFLK